MVSALRPHMFTPPRRRRLAKRLLERARERGLRLVSDLLCDVDEGHARAAKALRCDLHSPVRQVLHRRDADYARKPLGQSRTRKTDLTAQGIDRPVVVDPCMKL